MILIWVVLLYSHTHYQYWWNTQPCIFFFWSCLFVVIFLFLCLCMYLDSLRHICQNTFFEFFSFFFFLHPLIYWRDPGETKTKKQKKKKRKKTKSLNSPHFACRANLRVKSMYVALARLMQLIVWRRFPGCPGPNSWPLCHMLLFSTPLRARAARPGPGCQQEGLRRPTEFTTHKWKTQASTEFFMRRGLWILLI